MNKVNWIPYAVCLLGIASLLWAYWLDTRKEPELREMGVKLSGKVEEEDEIEYELGNVRG